MSKIYVIIGPTGVGKTSLSIKLAKKLNAEIISCDSIQIYKELNIGSAKIKEQEKENIPHHMLDIVSVKDKYSVFDYQKQGRAILDKLIKENKNIVIVGGTGLYLKALLYDYTFDNKEKKDDPLYDFKLIGLTLDREKLYQRINNRVDQMINEGLINEVRNLYKNKIKNRVVVKTAIGYKELYQYFKFKITEQEAINNIKQNSRKYAKRQYTFFNNQFKDINWYNIEEITIDEIVKEVAKGK